VLVERRDAAGRLHGYGADYTPYVLAADERVAIGSIVDAVGETAGETAIAGRIA
jgi:hypothetical protein